MIKKLVIFIIISLLIIAAFFFALPRLIVIKSISCKSQYGPCSQFILEKIEKAKVTNLAESKKLLNDILTSEVIVYKYNLKIYLPDRLDIQLIERKAQIAIQQDGYQGMALIDDEGLVLVYEEKA